MEKKEIKKEEIKEEIKEDVVEEPKEEKKPEKKGITLEVIKTTEYDKYGEIIKLTPKAHTFRRYIIEGDIIEVSEEEAKELTKLGICKRI